MNHTSESLEDRNAGRNEDSRDPDWEVPEENKDSIRNWAKGHLGDAPSQRVLAAFCPHL